MIGYLSEPQDDQNVTERLYATRYISAVYQLAPLVIADSTEPEMILGNFFSPQAMEKAMAGRNLVVLNDFHNGVFIFRKGGSR